MEDFNYYFFEAQISSLSVFIPLLTGLIFFKKLATSQYILLLNVCMAALTELIATTLADRGQNNMPLFHIYIIIEFTVLLVYFRRIFKGVGINLMVVVPSAAFLLFAIINALYLESIYTFNANTISLASIILILLALNYLYLLSTRSTVLYITEYPAFWGSVAVLFYFAGNIFIFGYYRLMVENWQEVSHAVWSIHSFFNIGFNLLLTKALWKPKPA